MKNRFLIILAFVFIFAISGVGLGMTGVSLASHKKADERSNIRYAQEVIK